MTMMTTTPALALEYNVSDKAAGEFGKSTSVETVTVVGEEKLFNVNVSKDSAFVPPTFGSPSADTKGTGYLLTPNISGVGEMNIGSGAGGVNIPNSSASNIAQFPPSNGTNDTGYASSDKFTLPDGLYYADGSIGTLKIPSVNLSVKVYETESLESHARGAGHFKSTSCWDGNIGIAGHNRGVTNHFGKIHTLKKGDKIKYTTKLGTRTYRVKTVTKIKETDYSYLERTSDHRITLITCVENVPGKRWCVQAVEVK